MWNSKTWKKVIIILAAIAAAALIAGGYCYYSHINTDFISCICMTLQNCMESLLFNPILTIQDIVSDTDFVSGIGSVEKGIMIMYSLAMILAPFVDILIIFSVLDSFLHLFVGAGNKERHILIVGYNDTVQKVIERKNENGKVFLWTENFLSTDEERTLYLKKVSVKMNDFSLGDSREEYKKQREKFNRFIKRKGITDILLLNESDAKNIQYYMALSSCDICRQKTIHFYVLNKSFEARNMLQDYFDSKLEKRKQDLQDAVSMNQDTPATEQNSSPINQDTPATEQETPPINQNTPPMNQDTHMDLRIFNYDQIQVEEMLSRMPLYTGKEDSDDKTVHLLIVGGDSLCMYTALYAMNQAVFSKDNKIVIDIVNDSIDDIRSGLSIRFDKSLVNKTKNSFSITSDKIDGLIKIRLSNCKLMDSKLTSVLSKLQDEESGVFTYIALCSKNIDENLHVFRCIDKANLITSGMSIPVAMRMSFTEEMEEYLSSFEWCSRLFFMGENEEYIGLDQIVNLDEERYIRTYNAIYGAVADSKIYLKNAEISGAAEKEIKWNDLVYDKRQSNRALYHHKKIKETLFSNYEDEMRCFWEENKSHSEPDMAKVLSERLVTGSYPKLLAMAQAEHRRWAYFYASEGWRYSVEKKTEKRLHDCLCNWEELQRLKPDVLIFDLISSPLLMMSEEEGQ